MASDEYTLGPSVSLPMSGTRSGIVTDERVFCADTLFEITREELRERSWPRGVYTAQAVDFAQVSGASQDALALGDRVMVADGNSGVATWVTLTRITRRLENPMDVEGEFESTTPSLGEFLASREDARQAAELMAVELPGQEAAADGYIYVRDSDQKEGSRWDNFEGITGQNPDDIDHDNRPTLDDIANHAPAATGEGLVKAAGGGTEWAALSDAAKDHAHPEQITIDSIPDITGKTVGYALLVAAGNVFSYGAVGDGAADHTHPELATLNLIESADGKPDGSVLKLDAVLNIAKWGTQSIYDWEYGATQLIDGDKIRWWTIQHTYIAKVTLDQTAGGVSQYKVEILTPTTAKTGTGVFLNNCLVADDSQDVFAVGTVVMVAAPSEDQAAAGELPLITGAFEIHETAPPHSHVSALFGYLAAWTG